MCVRTSCHSSWELPRLELSITVLLARYPIRERHRSNIYSPSTVPYVISLSPDSYIGLHLTPPTHMQAARDPGKQKNGNPYLIPAPAGTISAACASHSVLTGLSLKGSTSKPVSTASKQCGLTVIRGSSPQQEFARAAQGSRSAISHLVSRSVEQSTGHPRHPNWIEPQCSAPASSTRPLGIREWSRGRTEIWSSRWRELA